MRLLFILMANFSKVISFTAFLCGLVILGLAGYDFVHAVKLLFEDIDNRPGIVAILILKTIDFILISLVFFIFSLGVSILFTGESAKKREVMDTLPKWLQIKNLTELKIILWETILTTFIVTYITDITGKRLRPDYTGFTAYDLVLPAAVFLFAISLYFLKKGEKQKRINFYISLLLNFYLRIS